MTPYYEQDGIVIYHGDCREVIPTLERIELVLTDPPYGIERGGGNLDRHKGDYESPFSDDSAYIADVVVPVIADLMTRAQCVVVTPGNANFASYPQPDSFGAFYQPAAVGMQSFGNVDAQPIFYYGTAGGGRLGKPCSWVLTETPERNGHPCPKPFNAWKRLLATVARPGQLVFDPFMGSGTTLVAAKDMGHPAIGVELSERYCEIAAKRLAQGALPLEMGA